MAEGKKNLPVMNNETTRQLLSKWATVRKPDSDCCSIGQQVSNAFFYITQVVYYFLNRNGNHSPETHYYGIII